jgi:hypothetical protein
MTDDQKPDEEPKVIVLEAEPGHYVVTISDVSISAGSTTSLIESITTEFSKRIREKADQVRDTDVGRRPSDGQ